MLAPRVPVEKLSTKCTVFTSRGTAVPPEVITASREEGDVASRKCANLARFASGVVIWFFVRKASILGKSYLKLGLAAACRIWPASSD